MRAIIILITTLATSGAMAAPADCIKIDNDLDRLGCYDKETGRTPTAETFAKGVWSVQEQTSKMTDQTNVFMSVESNEVINCGWNRGDKIRLVVRCLENTTSMIFSTGCHMTSGGYTDYGDITYRLDEENARTVSGEASTNNRSLGLWSGGRSIPVVKRMFGKSEMIVRMTPYGENPFTATFNVSGLEEAITPLRKACHW